MRYELEWITPVEHNKIILEGNEEQFFVIRKALSEGIGLVIANKEDEVIIFGGELVKRSIFALRRVHEDNS